MHDPDSGGIVHIRPRLAVSSCLLGQAVRYDGRHKRHDWLVDTLGRWVDLEPLCPEVSIGLGIPREPIELTGDPRHPRVRGVNHRDRDATAALQAEGRRVAASLGGVAGYVFKSRSPSCGLRRVGVRTGSGNVVPRGRGVYASTILKALPCLPVEEESVLNDVVRRENFVVCLYTYQRWLSLSIEGMTARRLLDFHARHKYLLMAHSPRACDRLGRWLENLRDIDHPAAHAGKYLSGLILALRRPCGIARHFQVLQQILDDLERHLPGAETAELLAILESCRRGELPLSVPIARLREHFWRRPDECMEMQWYLWPCPDELGLREPL